MIDRAEPTISNALKVMVYTPWIRAYLEANDPKALEQAEEALALEEASPDCPRCQGAGLIDQGYIINGQVTNLTREQCPCITRTVDSY